MKLWYLVHAAIWTELASAQVAQSPLTSRPLADIPLIGFGTWNLKGDNISEVVSLAIQAGYRHIDAAKIYGNQVEVGKGIQDGLKKARLSRSDIWVTSKLWNNKHYPNNNVYSALKETLEELSLDYLDLYLMHWPVSSVPPKPEIEFLDTWRTMDQVRKDSKLVRRIGVANFSPKMLEAIVNDDRSAAPYAHQFELHPYLKQQDFVEWHSSHEIHVTAYSPLGNTNPTYSSPRKNRAAEAVPPLLSNEILLDIAQQRKCTPAQVALKWGMLRGTSVIPKSQHANFIRENFKATDCALKQSDIERLGQDLPTKRFNNPSRTWRVCIFEGLEDAECENILVNGRVVQLMRIAEELISDMIKVVTSFN